ncbi:MAG: carbohydrate ABC transporter permease [Anaerolineae bacterium]
MTEPGSQAVQVPIAETTGIALEHRSQADLTKQLRRERRTQRLVQGGLHAGLILWALFAVYPLYWILLTSLKHTRELYADPFGLPLHWKWSNYVEAWVHAKMGIYFLNSTLLTVLSLVLVLILSSMAAFALARFDFRLKPIVWGYILFGFLIPHSTLLVPLAIFTRHIGLYNRLYGLALVYTAVGIPWNIFFLRAFMETIPKELEEAAIMDGAQMWVVFWRIIVPLSQPALATMATFHILSAWSEYILALVLTGTTASRTLPVGISLLEGHFTSNEPGVAAGMAITIVPVVLAFAFLQRYVIKGMTAGALKG